MIRHDVIEEIDGFQEGMESEAAPVFLTWVDGEWVQAFNYKMNQWWSPIVQHGD